MEGGMHDDDLDGGGPRLLWRLVGAVISMMLVSEYIVLVAATLTVRVLLALAAEAWRWLLPPHDSPRDVATPGAEAVGFHDLSPRPDHKHSPQARAA
jgi:hypothetical protein